MRKVILGAALLVLGAVACNKERNYTRAIILDTGDVTSEGCGYLLRLEDGREEKPVYVPSAFQHNGMEVLVKYHSTGVNDTCEFTSPRKFFELVEIEDIKKRID